LHGARCPLLNKNSFRPIRYSKEKASESHLSINWHKKSGHSKK
jgi:hypothetical protein